MHTNDKTLLCKLGQIVCEQNVQEEELKRKVDLFLTKLRKDFISWSKPHKYLMEQAVVYLRQIKI